MKLQEKEIIASSATVAMFLTQIAHAVAAGAREDIIKSHFENAKVHWEYLTELFDESLG